MPLFRYESISLNGAKIKGSIAAANDREARDKLREQGIVLLKISTGQSKTKAIALKSRNLLTFTVQLSQMVGAGIPLYDSMKALEEQYRHETFSPVIASLCEQIKNGKMLSEAMLSFPESFDNLYRTMVAAGEKSGALGTMLSRLSALLKKQNTMKSQTITALIYPAILSCFTLAVIFLLLAFVVPSIEEIFDTTHLNSYTKIVLAISHVLSGYWALYLPVFAGALIFTTLFFKDPKGKRWLETIAIRVPLIRTAVIQVSLARFSRTMATLQEGGVSIVDSLHLARMVMKNAVLEKIIADAAETIVTGKSLSRQLGLSPLIPSIVPRMLAVGEDTGTVALMFGKIADIFEEDTEKTLARLTALAQPVILVILGAIVGLVLLAVLLPFTDITALAP